MVLETQAQRLAVQVLHPQLQVTTAALKNKGLELHGPLHGTKHQQSA